MTSFSSSSASSTLFKVSACGVQLVLAGWEVCQLESNNLLLFLFHFVLLWGTSWLSPSLKVYPFSGIFSLLAQRLVAVYLDAEDHFISVGTR